MASQLMNLTRQVPESELPRDLHCIPCGSTDIEPQAENAFGLLRCRDCGEKFTLAHFKSWNGG